MITFTEKMQDTQSNLTLQYDEKHEMQDKAIKEMHDSVEAPLQCHLVINLVT